MEQDKNLLLEDLTEAGDINIAQTDQNLSIDGIFQQTYIQSLAKEICSTATLTGPTGAIFNIIKNGDGFKLIRKEVECLPSEIKKTSITREAIQDLRNIFGKDADKIIGEMFRGISNEIENAALLDILSAVSKDDGDLQLSDSNNAETNVSEIFQRINKLILQMNQKYFRSYDAFVILPASSLGSIMGLSKYLRADNFNSNGLYIVTIGKVKFYLNPDQSDDFVYLGLKDSENLSKSSLVYSPYQNQILEAINPDDGEVCYFLVNRFAITPSPLHILGDEMLYKFKILS